MRRLYTASIALGLLAAVILQSCIYYPRNYYVYQPHNVPMLRDSGEVALDVGATCNYEANFYWPFTVPEHESYGFNIDAAYSPIKNFGIMGGYNFYNDHNNNSITAHNGELAVGYYRPFGTYWVFDVYGGDRFTFQKHLFDNGNQGSAHVQMHNIFVQPSIGFSYAPVDLVYGVRIGYAYYNSIDHNITHEKEAEAINWLVKNRGHLMGEYSLTLRAGYKDIKAQLQLSHGFKLGQTYENMPQLNSFTVSLGLHFCFGRTYP